MVKSWFAHSTMWNLTMPIQLNKLCQHSPYLYHLTYKPNLKWIKNTRCLKSAASLLKDGNHELFLKQKRPEILKFNVDGKLVTLTDQKTINENNISFEDGWSIADLIEAINHRVFFWRGNKNGLLQFNQGHFEKYKNAENELVFLRLEFEETCKLNKDRGPEFCKYNSGAARQNHGRRVPRGPKTFVKAEHADFSLKDVKEVVFLNYVELPNKTQYCLDSFCGPWVDLQDY